MKSLIMTARDNNQQIMTYPHGNDSSSVVLVPGTPAIGRSSRGAHALDLKSSRVAQSRGRTISYAYNGTRGIPGMQTLGTHQRNAQDVQEQLLASSGMNPALESPDLLDCFRSGTPPFEGQDNLGNVLLLETPL